MFTQSEIETKLNEEIASVLADMANVDKLSEEYGTLVERLSKLHKLKSDETSNQCKITEIEHKFEIDSRRKSISPDTALIVAANLFGILRITTFEREGVISTKALSTLR